MQESSGKLSASKDSRAATTTRRASNNLKLIGFVFVPPGTPENSPALTDDILFLGKSYETLFDRFEVLCSLEFACEAATRSGCLWAPLGRFAWKHRSRRIQHGPFEEIVKEAKSRGPNWSPLKSGFFGGDEDRIDEIVQYYQIVIAQQPWY